MAWRLKIEDVSCEVDESNVRARVQLTHAGLAHLGLASGQRSVHSQETVVAQATINAVRMYAAFVGTEFAAVIDSVTEFSAETQPLVVVSIKMEGEGRWRFLSGSVPAAGDRYLAVARAVLHGLNRRIEELPS